MHIVRLWGDAPAAPTPLAVALGRVLAFPVLGLRLFEERSAPVLCRAGAGLKSYRKAGAGLRMCRYTRAASGLVEGGVYPSADVEVLLVSMDSNALPDGAVWRYSTHMQRI
jgi:hypothetical protein